MGRETPRRQEDSPTIYNSDQAEPPPEINDPAFGTAGAKYISHQEEMTARAPFFSTGTTVSATFTADNNAIWELLQKICKKHTCWTVLRSWQKTKDGRNALLALYNHYLGPSKVDNMAGEGEKNLTMAAYKGETKRWNFDKYVRVHMDQHQILTDLKDHGYIGIDERSKVRHLMAGIKTDNLDAVKT